MSVLVNKSAPDFTVPAVLADGTLVDEFNFSEHIKGKYALLFFYPLDFTFVCPSELIALDHKIPEFKERGIEVVAGSVDSQYTHFAWRNTPVDKGGIGEVKYTLIGDISHTVSQAYGIQHAEASVALRAAFIIDKKGVVRAELVHDLPFGRNIEEILRLFDAVEFYEQHGAVCPAGWKKGDKGMEATTQGVAKYLAEKATEL